MDRATEIIKLLNDNKSIAMWSKSTYGEVECGLIESNAADLIRPHLAPKNDRMFPATFTMFELSDDEQTVRLTYNAKMKDIVPLRMALGVEYRLTVIPEAPLTAPNQYMDLCDDPLPEAKNE